MLGPYYITSTNRRYRVWGNPSRNGYADRVTLDGKSYMVNPLAKKAFQAWEQIRNQHNYRLTGGDTGIWNYRHMRHDSNLPLSVHSWAMALDANWVENPAGSKLYTDIPANMIADIMAVRTHSGARVFRWLGDPDNNPDTKHSYYDAMHFEVIAHPEDLKTGIAGSRSIMVIAEGMEGNYVRPFQELLNKAGEINAIDGFEPIEVDGKFGQKSKALTRLYQKAAGLGETGTLDDLTRDLLLRYDDEPAIVKAG